MLTIENSEVIGWKHVIRGMRNPMNSWNNSDSYELNCDPISKNIPHIKNEYQIGSNDLDLMRRLREAGNDHRKFMRMIVVYLDVTAPLYWWKEFDTYKVGTVANSCSTMHKIQDKEFTLDDFSHEHLSGERELSLDDHCPGIFGATQEFSGSSISILRIICDALNFYRQKFLETKNKDFWWQMIQLLPTSYNQKRTIMLNYEVLANLYKSRRNHKLDEWHTLCDWIETLPYNELITGKVI